MMWCAGVNCNLQSLPAHEQADTYSAVDLKHAVDPIRTVD